ncbi:hypothetical protein F4779DRAFT_637855 [Xylariaceae sp. FL0662B]|nr:hypothetical protein F4779DRAFT_637855 [Xylariaceae sp. FL0662B]
MVECPDNDEFYDCLEKFLHLSHCPLHREQAQAKFASWKQLRTALALRPEEAPARQYRDSTESGEREVPAVSGLVFRAPAGDRPMTPQAQTEESAIPAFDLRREGRADSPTREQRQDGDSDSESSEHGTEQDLGRYINRTRGSKSKLIHQIHAPFTARDKEVGVVYALKHVTNPGFFKVGWSRHSAATRLVQHANCYGNNTELIYESLRLRGAFKVEKLVHATLREKQMLVIECRSCEVCHKEWFRATRNEVETTIKAWIKFVQSGAYRNDKLSEVGQAYMDMLVDLSPERIELLLQDSEDLSNQSSGQAASAGSLGRLAAPPTDLAAQPDGRAAATVETALAEDSFSARPSVWAQGHQRPQSLPFDVSGSGIFDSPIKEPVQDTAAQDVAGTRLRRSKSRAPRERSRSRIDSAKEMVRRVARRSSRPALPATDASREEVHDTDIVRDEGRIVEIFENTWQQLYARELRDSREDAVPDAEDVRPVTDWTPRIGSGQFFQRHWREARP